MGISLPLFFPNPLLLTFSFHIALEDGTQPQIRGFVTASHIDESASTLNAALVSQLNIQLPNMKTLPGTLNSNMLSELSDTLTKIRKIADTIKQISSPDGWAQFRTNYDKEKALEVIEMINEVS